MPFKLDFSHFLAHHKSIKTPEKIFLKGIVVFTISTPGKQKIKNAFADLSCKATEISCHESVFALK